MISICSLYQRFPENPVGVHIILSKLSPQIVDGTRDNDIIKIAKFTQISSADLRPAPGCGSSAWIVFSDGWDRLGRIPAPAPR